MSLEDFTYRELEQELKRRKIKILIQPMLAPHLYKISDVCKSYVAYLVSDEYHEDNDWKQYIYETVLEAIYGATFWNWKKENIK